MPQATPQQLRRARRPRRVGQGAVARRDRGAARGRAETTSSGSWRSPPGLRDLGHGRTVTYSRKVFIPLTMLCRDHCHYCTFAKPPAKLDHPFLTPDEVVAIAEAGRGWAARKRSSRSATVRRSATTSRATWLDERGFGSTLGLPPRGRDPRDRGPLRRSSSATASASTTSAWSPTTRTRTARGPTPRRSSGPARRHPRPTTCASSRGRTRRSCSTSPCRFASMPDVSSSNFQLVLVPATPKSASWKRPGVAATLRATSSP